MVARRCSNTTAPIHSDLAERAKQMETIVGKILGDLAALVSTKWYAGMGLVGLIVVMWVMLVGTPQDDLLIGAIGCAMMGFGFAEAETRTFREIIGPTYKITEPRRAYSGPSIALYALGALGLIAAVLRGAWLLWLA